MNGLAALQQIHELLPSEDEKMLYDLIWSKGSLGIWTADLRRETVLTNTAFTEALRSLQAKNLIKSVINSHSKTKEFYVAVEFAPPIEISGGLWYYDGRIDFEFIMVLMDQCRRHVRNLNVATVENVWQAVKDSGVFATECTMEQIKEILVLGKEIQEMTSSGVGEFAHIQAGQKCYMISETGAGSTSGYT